MQYFPPIIKSIHQYIHLYIHGILTILLTQSFSTQTIHIILPLIAFIQSCIRFNHPSICLALSIQPYPIQLIIMNSIQQTKSSFASNSLIRSIYSYSSISVQFNLKKLSSFQTFINSTNKSSILSPSKPRIESNSSNLDPINLLFLPNSIDLCIRSV